MRMIPSAPRDTGGQAEMPGLTVSLMDGVRLDCRRAGLERFDALIVDEGQDLFEMDCLDTLDGVLAGGLEAGRWCWFHDLNNQSPTPRFDRRAKERLESLDPLRMPLRIDCRNTRGILEWIQDTLGVHGAGAGPAVRRQSAVTRRGSAERVARASRFAATIGPASGSTRNPWLCRGPCAGSPGSLRTGFDPDTRTPARLTAAFPPYTTAGRRLRTGESP